MELDISSFRFVPFHVRLSLSVSAAALLSSSLSLRSILFLPHRIAPFLSRPSSLPPRPVPDSKCLDGGLTAPVIAQGVCAHDLRNPGPRQPSTAVHPSLPIFVHKLYKATVQDMM
ncbi:hypothetical protein F2P81_002407 [Scophthalmus maximus]|uniref:Uncharacterized protein n=1 Tax=Scophthalmus maximus TaxID=52904 RepID=A0A6A4TNC5_SCOMX|nr:hypothetical protein F2P81_002407 [Scophthalmus maximus]